MDEDQSASDIRTLTAEIVASYVTSNSLRSADLPELIGSVYGALRGLGASPAPAAAQPLEKPVSIKKSVHSDYLISMEDGKQYQSLKRHLAGRGLTPVDYRAKWGLPDDYPMTAPGYSERRSALAKSLGLGRKRSEPSIDEEPAPVQDDTSTASEPDATPEAAPKAKRGRKKSNG